MRSFSLFLCLPLVVSSAAVSAQNLAPGLPAPTNGMVYLMSPNATPRLDEVYATEISSDSHAASNFARGMVYSGPRLGVDVDGAHASVQGAPGSVFFVRVGTDDPDLLTERTQLLRLKVKGDRRIVSTYSQNVFGGSRKRSEDKIAITKKPVAGTPGWIEVKPTAALAPGQYAIVQDPKDPNMFAEEVYAFEVGGDREPPLT